MVEKKREELAELSLQLKRREKIDAMLQSLEHDERKFTQQEKRLNNALAKEKADVDRLERTTATSVLYSILGKKEAKMDQEQKEVYAAKLKYHSALRQLEDCKMHIIQLRQERDSIGDCARQYDLIFEELKELLRSDPGYTERLFTLERQRSETVSQLKELDEAITAGSAAMELIKEMENSLQSAESWGTWDLLGGGLVTTMAKHSHLDNAQKDAEQLQVLLSRFRTELADVSMNAELGAVNVEGFLRFADYFFDGLLADWSVLSRIHDSQKSIYEVKQQVGDALMKLSDMKKARIAEKTSCDQALTQLVANS